MKQKRKEALYWVLKELGFYFCLILFVVCVFFFKNNSGGAPATIGGFSMMQVLTGSMEIEIPKGSLIVTRRVDPDTLEVGDDITYLISENTTITHRIVEIIEEYLDTGERAFITQGICNAKPDSEPAAAVNVVGKVIFHSYLLGQILGFLQMNWGYLVVLFVLVTALFRTLKVLLHKEQKKEIVQDEPQEELQKEHLEQGKEESQEELQREHLELMKEEKDGSE